MTDAAMLKILKRIQSAVMGGSSIAVRIGECVDELSRREKERKNAKAE